MFDATKVRSYPLLFLLPVFLPLPAQPPRLQLSPRPTVVIEDDGSVDKQFTRVAVRRLVNGDIVVGELAAHRLQIYGPNSALKRTIAKRGNGPGELPGEFHLVVTGDSLYAFGISPGSNNFVRVFASTGESRNEDRFTDNGRAVRAQSRLVNGAWLVAAGPAFKVLRTPPEVGCCTNDSTTYGVLIPGTAEARVHWFKPVLTSWMVGHEWPGGPMPALSQYPYKPRVFVAASGDRVWFADAESATLTAFDHNARQIVSRKLNWTARSLDRAAVTRGEAHRLRQATRAIDTVKARAIANAAYFPPRLPHFDLAFGTDDGGLWLRKSNEDVGAPQQFVIVDRDGRERAEIVVPAHIDVQHVGRNFLLGITRDDDGVITIVEYGVLTAPR